MKIFSQINNSSNGLLLICFSKIGFSSNLCPKDQLCAAIADFSHVACVLCIWFPNFDLFVQYNILHNPYIWFYKCLGHRFEEKPILLKHISNRPLPELLIWEKIFIYKNKEVAINFETPQFSDLYKLMDADGGRKKALVTSQSNSSWGWREHSSKVLLHSSKFSEAKWLKIFNLCIMNNILVARTARCN